jgi:hypothetical protein
MEINEMSAWGLEQAISKIIEQGFVEDPETGEIIFQGENLEELHEALENKINNIAGYIKYCESKSETFKQRKSEIDNLQKYYNKKAESLKKFLSNYLIENNKEKGMDTDDYKITFRKSTKGEVSDAQILMGWIKSDKERTTNYLKIAEPEIALNEIKKYATTNNVDVPGFNLIENNNIQIK